MYSGNDAASAIATHIGGSTEEFVSMMNSYAAKLGCTGTHFTNPHGLQDENHYTTPYDIYLMLKEALKYPEFTEITQMSSYTLAYKNSEGADMSVSLMANRSVSYRRIYRAEGDHHSGRKDRYHQ